MSRFDFGAKPRQPQRHGRFQSRLAALQASIVLETGSNDD
jgi:hypothetical protein